MDFDWQSLAKPALNLDYESVSISMQTMEGN